MEIFSRPPTRRVEQPVEVKIGGRVDLWPIHPVVVVIRSDVGGNEKYAAFWDAHVLASFIVVNHRPHPFGDSESGVYSTP
jgi:hypothetical protein